MQFSLKSFINVKFLFKAFKNDKKNIQFHVVYKLTSVVRINIFVEKAIKVVMSTEALGGH